MTVFYKKTKGLYNTCFLIWFIMTKKIDTMCKKIFSKVQNKELRL